jgi:molybdate transport system ATP-binding protein
MGRPEILLLDEPFSALDLGVRETLRQELLEILADYRGTILLVTHDLQEAYLMASTIAVIDGGKILQVGGRVEVLHRPRTRRVAEHTGTKNILRGVASRDAIGSWDIEWQGFHLWVDGQVPSREGAIEFCIRPEDIRLVWPEKVSERPNVMRGRIVREIERGLDHLLHVAIGGDRGPRGYDLEIQVADHLRHLMMLHVGKEVFLSLPPDRLHLLAPDE